MPSVTRVSRFGFVNAYLVEEDDGLTLIDALVPRAGKAVLAKADELDRPIVRIAPTHAHGDHIGSLDELAGQPPAAEVSTSVREARRLAGGKSRGPGEANGKLRGSWGGGKTKPHRTFNPG